MDVMSLVIALTLVSLITVLEGGITNTGTVLENKDTVS